MEKIQEINLYEIRPSAMNPRKTFDKESLQELAPSRPRLPRAPLRPCPRR